MSTDVPASPAVPPSAAPSAAPPAPAPAAESRRLAWYALLACAPTPESGESANVAVLLSSADPRVDAEAVAAVGYVPGLPRLAGIAGRDEIAVYDLLVAHIAREVAAGAAGSVGGVSLGALRASLGPQLVIRPSRVLYEPASAALLARLVARYLAAPESAA